MTAPVHEIKISSDHPSFKFHTEIEAKQYIFEISWNDRGGRWYCSLYDANEQPILYGIPMNINLDLFGKFKDERLFQGSIMLFDTSGMNQECGRDDLGSRCRLLYQGVET